MSCFSSKWLSEDSIDIGLDALKAIADVGGDLAALAPIQGLDTGFSVLSSIVEKVQQARGNVETRKQLVDQVRTLVSTLKDVLKKAEDAGEQLSPADREKLNEKLKVELCSSSELRTRVATLVKDLQGAEKDAEKLGESSFFLRCLCSTRDADVLVKIRDHIKSATEVFQLGSQAAVERIINNVSDSLKELKEQISRAEDERSTRERKAALERAAKANEEILQQLPAVEASYRSEHNKMKSHFLQGTRTTILDRLEMWARSDVTMQQYIYVLSGVAGAGKSTIAYEFARRLEKDRLLGGTFFFVRGDDKLSTTRFVIPTLAYQLSQNHPDVLPHIVEGARKHLKQGQRQQVEYQLADLIIDPLKAIPSHHPPLVFIVDAVDECTSSAQDEVARLLYLLLDRIRGLSFPLRILVTTRPELHIENALISYEKFQEVATPFKLENIPRPTVDSDIALYLEERLRQFRYKNELLSERRHAIAELTTRAESLFIYAYIALEFLIAGADGPGYAVEHLDVLLSDTSGSPTVMNQLDNLYLTVLTAAFSERILTENPGYRGWLRVVLGAIALAQDHVSPKTLESLLGVTATNIQRILSRLGSLVIASTEDASVPMRPLHASFPQFLVDKGRCTNVTFLVDCSSYHHQLALCCLKALMEPHALPAICDTQLSPDLQYSCVHWPAHLADTDKPSQELLKALGKFVAVYLLRWFEALSYMHRVEIAAPALLRLHAWYQAHIDADDASTQTLALLYDGYRFILEYFVPIQEDPQHIYVSALPLMPSCMLRSAYEFSHAARVPAARLVTERDSGWSACLRVIEGHTGGVKCVRFSPDGRHIVSGSNDCTLRTWNADTGAALSTMQGHSRWVNSVSFSPDSNNLQVVSGSDDGTLCTWDFSSGAPLYLMRPNADNSDCNVKTVAYSPDGRYILSGPEHSRNALSCWNAVDDKSHGIEAGSRLNSVTYSLPPDLEAIHSIAFSVDGSKVVAVYSNVESRRYEARIWDARNGQLLRSFPSDSDIWDAAFTHDGSAVVFGNWRSVDVWDVETGVRRVSLQGWVIGIPLSIAVSKELIASGHNDYTIWLWDSDSYRLLSILHGHTGIVTSLSFSPDGRKLASASDDSTVRVWDVADKRTGPTVVENPEVLCLAVSSDGARIANSTSNYDNIVIWDASTGKRLRTLKGRAWYLAFSPDHRRLASGEADKVVVWDTETGQLLQTLSHQAPDGRVNFGGIVYSPDGEWIACGHAQPEEVCIWRSSDGSLQKTLSLPAWSSVSRLQLEFSLDNTKIHAESFNRDETLTWDIATGKVLDEPEHSWKLASKEPFEMEEGWIVLKQSRKKLCWLTGSKRAGRMTHCFKSVGNCCAVGAGSGEVTILNLSELVG